LHREVELVRFVRPEVDPRLRQHQRRWR